MHSSTKFAAPDHLKQTVESDISLNPFTPKKAVRQRSNQCMNYPKPPVEEKKKIIHQTNENVQLCIRYLLKEV